MLRLFLLEEAGALRKAFVQGFSGEPTEVLRFQATVSVCR